MGRIYLFNGCLCLFIIIWKNWRQFWKNKKFYQLARLFLRLVHYFVALINRRDSVYLREFVQSDRC